tara:strand:- start:425 stop:538 length:114 start_codon:yes stop_codon:yes gene_type:complete
MEEPIFFRVGMGDTGDEGEAAFVAAGPLRSSAIAAGL